MNHPILTKVAWRLMPTLILGYLFASVDRSTISLAEFPWQDALTVSDTASGLGASLALLVGAGAGFFRRPPGLRAREGAA